MAEDFAIKRAVLESMGKVATVTTYDTKPTEPRVFFHVAVSHKDYRYLCGVEKEDGTVHWVLHSPGRRCEYPDWAEWSAKVDFVTPLFGDGMRPKSMGNWVMPPLRDRQSQKSFAEAYEFYNECPRETVVEIQKLLADCHRADESRVGQMLYNLSAVPILPNVHKEIKAVYTPVY